MGEGSRPRDVPAAVCDIVYGFGRSRTEDDRAPSDSPKAPSPQGRPARTEELSFHQKRAGGFPIPTPLSPPPASWIREFLRPFPLPSGGLLESKEERGRVA